MCLPNQAVWHHHPVLKGQQTVLGPYLGTPPGSRVNRNQQNKTQVNVSFPIIFCFLISIDVFKNTEVFDTE